MLEQEEAEARVRGEQVPHVMKTDPDPRVRRCAHALLLVQEGHTQAGVARRRVAVRTVERLPRVLEAPQVTALLGALRSPRDLALIRLMLDGGLRPGEVPDLSVWGCFPSIDASFRFGGHAIPYNLKGS